MSFWKALNGYLASGGDLATGKMSLSEAFKKASSLGATGFCFKSKTATPGDKVDVFIKDDQCVAKKVFKNADWWTYKISYEVKNGYLVSGGDMHVGRMTVRRAIAKATELGSNGFCIKTKALPKEDEKVSVWIKDANCVAIGVSKAKGWFSYLATGPVYSSTKAPTPMHDSLNRQINKRRVHNVVVCQNAGDTKTGASASKTPTGEVVHGNRNAKGKIYEAHNINGFKFYIEKGAFASSLGLEEKLHGDTAEILRVMPKRATKGLQERAPIWINISSSAQGKEQRGAWCHWSGAGSWLIAHDQMPEKAGGVEILNCSHYLGWNQPSILLHELCHAYHNYRRRHVQKIVDEAYAKAMKTGKYATSERDGRSSNAKHYAANNSAEYFAEACEAFFSSRRFRNDYFPYIHCELKGFDPIAYKMVEDAFGIKGENQCSRAELPNSWIASLAKIDMKDLSSKFAKADADKNGLLDPDEVQRILPRVGLRNVSPSQLSAIIKAADVNKDGRLSYAEFTSWVTTKIGSAIKKK
eukprot:jgi/Bigna1/139761/aug1.52_g14469